VEAAEFSMSLPTTPTALENYRTVLKEGNIGRALLNSTIITGGTVLLLCLVCSMAGYVLQRRRGVPKGVQFLVLAGLIVPPAIVPTIWVLKTLRISGTMFSLIMIETAYAFSFTAILYKSFFSTIPRELDEAAIVDGCGPMRLFFGIVFPLLKPVTVTVIILQGISVWNSFQNPLYYLSGRNSMTMPLTVYMFFGIYRRYWNLVFADVVIIAIPVLVIYLFLQRQIIDGMTAGSIKA
jgi:raffinose/stachyose/melibiose transport system permease protein